MKIETTVKSVNVDGESLELRLQGWPATAAEGTMAEDYLLNVPATAKAKRAFYIGRKVNVTIDPV